MFQVCCTNRNLSRQAAASRLIEVAAGALRHDLAYILIECARLWNGFDSFLYLRIGLELYLEAFLHSEVRDQDFLLNLPLYPIRVLGEVRLGIANAVLGEIFAKRLHYAIVDVKFFCDSRLIPHEGAGEASYPTFQRIKNICSEQILLKMI